MIIVKGTACVLREEGVSGNIDVVGLPFPKDYVVCHDPNGEYLRPCDFYICKFTRGSLEEDRVNKDDVTLAHRFYGNAAKIDEGTIDLPDGDWQRVCLVDQIGYERLGSKHGPYEIGLYKHEYKDDGGNPVGVPLYECKGRTRAWRIRLPGDCIADERGFVKPLALFPSLFLPSLHPPRRHITMRKKPARKHRKPAAKKRATKRAANPTKKRARSAPKKRASRGKNPVRRTKKQVRRSVVQYSVHDRKANPARRRRAKKRATGFTRAVKRAKRVQGRKRNPARRRPHGRKSAYGRRRNPASSGGTKMTGWSVMDTVIVGTSVVGGMFLANVLDRFVATRHGASTVNTGAFHGAQAAKLISAPPDGMRMGAQAGLSILSVVGAYWLSKKGYKKTAEVAVGIGIGAGAHLATQLINDKLLPATMKVNEKMDNLAARLYPDLQEAGLALMAKEAADLRANTTAGRKSVV